jgi:hypothetical protein
MDNSSCFHYPPFANQRSTFYPLMNSYGSRQPYCQSRSLAPRQLEAQPYPYFDFTFGSHSNWAYGNANDSHLSVPHLLLPELDFPSSPSDTCSSQSTDMSPSPSPKPLHVVCNVPLIAPVPLPYHSPTFLQFDLPDADEDLSHPPYTQRPAKRKRDIAEDIDYVPPVPVKRRVGEFHSLPVTHCRPYRHCPAPGSQFRVRQRELRH